MAYSRPAGAADLPRGDALTASMVGIGMKFASHGRAEANIEDTLLAASAAGMQDDDLRVLAVLVTWLRLHHPRVNADRLYRAVQAYEGAGDTRVRAFWAAVGNWLRGEMKDQRFARFAGLYRGPRIDLLGVRGAFLLRRSGEDERFAESPLRVPAGVLRDRETDVLSPADLARRHATYRQRVVMGPTYRADMWAALDREPGLSAAELARRAYGSFGTAWQVKADRALLNG